MSRRDHDTVFTLAQKSGNVLGLILNTGLIVRPTGSQHLIAHLLPVNIRGINTERGSVKRSAPDFPRNGKIAVKDGSKPTDGQRMPLL